MDYYFKPTGFSSFCLEHNGKRLYDFKKDGWFSQETTAFVNGYTLSIKPTRWWSTKSMITYDKKNIGTIEFKNTQYFCTLCIEDQQQLDFVIKQREEYLLGFNMFDILLKEQAIITFKPLHIYKNEGFQVLLLEEEKVSNIPLNLLLGVLGFSCFHSIFSMHHIP